MTGWSLLFTMKAWGHTMFMISCRAISDAADVLMLKPARSSSRAIVAVPPDADALFAAPLDAGVTAMTDTATIAAAMKAKTDRCTKTLSVIRPTGSPRPGAGSGPHDLRSA